MLVILLVAAVVFSGSQIFPLPGAVPNETIGAIRAMQGIPPVEAMEMLISRLKKTRSNAEFLLSINR